MYPTLTLNRLCRGEVLDLARVGNTKAIVSGALICLPIHRENFNPNIIHKEELLLHSEIVEIFEENLSKIAKKN